MTRHQSTTVLLATRREVLSLGFGRVLGTAPDLSLVGVVGSVDDACRAVADELADVVVIDVELDGKDGVEISRRLSGAATGARHCYLVDRVDARTVARLTRGGAGGFITTTSSASDIRQALRHAGTGRLVMDPATALALAGDVLEPGVAAHGADLSDRERQLLELLVDGRTNREIASTLFVSEKTIKNGLCGLFRKLGVRSRTEAALLAATGIRTAPPARPPASRQAAA